MKRTVITHHATAYAPQKCEKIKNVLLDNGYALVWVAKNHHIPVNAQPYEEKIHTYGTATADKMPQHGFEI